MSSKDTALSPQLVLEFQSSSLGPWRRSELQDLAQSIFDKLPQPLRLKMRRRSLCLLIGFISEVDMRSLNFQLRKKKKATDVLSLDYNPGTPIAKLTTPARHAGPHLLGEVWLCPTYIRKQAQRLGHVYKDEITYLLIHGILHVLGYDHEQDELEAQAMFDLQNRIFTKIQNLNKATSRAFKLVEK